MQGINRVILVGRLTADPVLRKTSTDRSVASFTLALDRRGGQGSDQTADFINCVVWSAAADNVARYTHKGSLVGIEGRIQTRKYQDKQGNNRTAFEVVCDNVQFLESKNSQSSSNYSNNTSNYNTSPAPQAEPTYPEDDFGGGLDISTDDLPF